MNLKTEIFDYQNKAVEKLLPIRVGALFMEMGTGKTRTAIEIVHKRKNKINEIRSLFTMEQLLLKTVRSIVL